MDWQGNSHPQTFTDLVRAHQYTAEGQVERHPLPPSYLASVCNFARTQATAICAPLPAANVRKQVFAYIFNTCSRCWPLALLPSLRPSKVSVKCCEFLDPIFYCVCLFVNILFFREENLSVFNRVMTSGHAPLRSATWHSLALAPRMPQANSGPTPR